MLLKYGLLKKQRTKKRCLLLLKDCLHFGCVQRLCVLEGKEDVGVLREMCAPHRAKQRPMVKKTATRPGVWDIDRRPQKDGHRKELESAKNKNDF